VVALALVYRDMIGLPVLETFHDSYGLDGTTRTPQKYCNGCVGTERSAGFLASRHAWVMHDDGSARVWKQGFGGSSPSAARCMRQ
jgi:hypothetical protein